LLATTKKIPNNIYILNQAEKKKITSKYERVRGNKEGKGKKAIAMLSAICSGEEAPKKQVTLCHYVKGGEKGSEAWREGEHEY